MSRIFFIVIFFIFQLAGGAQTKSPSAFLGYEIGEKYTPHWKLVSYFQHIASENPGTVKLVQYGETNEGRPLLLAFISSSENMGRLEQIRVNNLRLAHLTPDKAAPVENGASAIVWLSYNVHGNETSSSEAAMLTIWSLVDPGNSRTKEWLKNLQGLKVNTQSRSSQRMNITDFLNMVKNVKN